MGWAVGTNCDRRDVGYGVPAICDHPRCNEAIDRGVDYACGGMHDGGRHGCGLYFCSAHRGASERRRDTNDYCARCRNGKESFRPKPDTLEWVEHKLTHESWGLWRSENPRQVTAMRARLAKEAGA